MIAVSLSRCQIFFPEFSRFSCSARLFKIDVISQLVKCPIFTASAKRRTSSDINLTFPKPKSPPPVPVPQTTSERTVSERPSRSKGGKPPLDVIQQNTEKLTTSRESSTLKKVTSPEKSKSGKNENKIFIDYCEL